MGLICEGLSGPKLQGWSVHARLRTRWKKGKGNMQVILTNPILTHFLVGNVIRVMCVN